VNDARTVIGAPLPPARTLPFAFQGRIDRVHIAYTLLDRA